MPTIDQNHDVFLVIDVQNDFCEGGALAVPDGDTVVPIINRVAQSFAHQVLSQDWHPPGHATFASSHRGRQPFETVEMPYGPQTLWPDHCVQQTHGAAFHPDLDLPGAELIVRKGHNRDIDSYSAFFENDHTTPTGLAGYLRERGFKRVFLAGLAFDFCVQFSALDAVAQGFETVVLTDACRSIDLEGSHALAVDAKRAAGVHLTTSNHITYGG